MIPLKLTLQGVYSYQKKAEIDFTKLTDSGLFGIFGMVGSGKSTILESISYALYGQVERLNKQDKVTYNLMNLKSNELLIDYEFTASDNQHYRFVVEGKRNSKNFEKIRTFDRSHYQMVEGEWKPTDKTAQDILELSYDNFRRTIIIPQGKFQEFLQLGDTDRTRMLKDIFGLGKYDLGQKLRPIEKENDEKITQVETKLQGVAEVTEESINEQRGILKELVASLEAQQNQLQEKSTQKTTLEQIKALFAELDRQKEELARLKQQADDFNSLERRVKEYETCLYQFSDLLETHKSTQQKIKQLQEVIGQKETHFGQIKQKLEQDEQSFEEVKKQYNERETIKQKIDEFGKIININELKKELVVLEERIEKGKPVIKDTEKKINKLLSEIDDKTFFIKRQKENLPDSNVLLAVSSWFAEKKKILSSIQKVNQESRHIEREIEKIRKEKKDLYEEHLRDLLPEAHPKTTIDELVDLMLDKRDDLKDQLVHTQHKLSGLTIKLKLQEYAENLTEGEPCPLCGSVHHPDPLKPDKIDAALHAFQEARETQDVQISLLDDLLHKTRHLKIQIDEKKKQLERRDEEAQAEANKFDLHLYEFRWKPEFDPDHDEDVEKKKMKASRLQNSIDDADKDREQMQRSLEDERKKLDKYKTAIVELENQQLTKTTQLKTLKRQLQVLSLDDYTQHAASQLKQEIRSLEDLYERVERKYKNLEVQINQDRDQKVRLESDLRNSRENLLQDQQRLQTNQDKLQDRLQKSDFGTLETVENILQNKLDIERENQKIKEFQTKLNRAEDECNKLEQQTAGKVYNEDEYQQVLTDIRSLQEDIQVKQDRRGGLKSEIERLESDLARKFELQKHADALHLRRDDINTLKKMFRESGFVNYISSVYMQNLCNLANERFYRLTKQQLKLEVNEDNTFYIRDYLNNGQIRSVKTLSGGQTFQAALSLALALADNIQQFTKSNQNFFFLDEGFGSQDEESLNAVFETLTSLRKENRIVGIISHVESLQREISVYLKVRNQEETGSVLQKSWEQA
jgi:exonuclease SbcC